VLDIGQGSAYADSGWMHKLLMALLDPDNDEVEPLTPTQRAELIDLLLLVGPRAQDSGPKPPTYHQAVLQKLSA